MRSSPKASGKLRTRLRHSSRPALEAHLSVSQVTVDEVAYRTLIVTDVSTLTKVQRESQSKDQFLAMLAHELRNPLGAIEGAVQVLELTTLREPRAIHARDVIHRQAVHMARLVDDLLDVGRVMTGKIVLERQPRRPRRERSDLHCRNHLGPERSAGRVEMTVEPVWVNADPVRLEQIVTNLVSNALKFSPGDKPVRVSVTRPRDRRGACASPTKGAASARTCCRTSSTSSSRETTPETAPRAGSASA